MIALKRLYLPQKLFLDVILCHKLRLVSQSMQKDFGVKIINKDIHLGIISLVLFEDADGFETKENGEKYQHDQ